MKPLSAIFVFLWVFFSGCSQSDENATTTTTERYFPPLNINDFVSTTPHSWNSAGKTLTSVIVGMAEEDGYQKRE